MRMSALEEYNQHRKNLKKKREQAKKSKQPVQKHPHKLPVRQGG